MLKEKFLNLYFNKTKTEKIGGNSNLRKANSSKNDEFYTQISDIENELKHYKEHFRDKVVFCNCDDPYESNFFKYFAGNFKHLGLKKLIAMGFSTSPIVDTQLRLFDIEGIENTKSKAYKIEMTDLIDINEDGALDLMDVEILAKKNKNHIKITILKGDGDFRSEESLLCLKEADIVVTNPPFSLFREYIETIVFYEKKFLVIGNMNAITYKEIFKLIKENKLWAGYGFNLSLVFKAPYENTLEANIKFCEQKGYFGKNFIKTPAINWFTNLEHKKRNEEIILYEKYSPKKYPKYDNYDAINIDKVTEIPIDYNGEMGVPITFLGKYNPEQFKILEGLNRYTVLDEKGLNNWAKKNKIHLTQINGKSTYFRIIIKRKNLGK